MNNSSKRKKINLNFSNNILLPKNSSSRPKNSHPKNSQRRSISPAPELFSSKGTAPIEELIKSINTNKKIQGIFKTQILECLEELKILFLQYTKTGKKSQKMSNDFWKKWSQLLDIFNSFFNQIETIPERFTKKVQILQKIIMDIEEQPNTSINMNFIQLLSEAVDSLQQKETQFQKTNEIIEILDEIQVLLTENPDISEQFSKKMSTFNSTLSAIYQLVNEYSDISSLSKNTFNELDICKVKIQASIPITSTNRTVGNEKLSPKKSVKTSPKQSPRLSANGSSDHINLNLNINSNSNSPVKKRSLSPKGSLKSTKNVQPRQRRLSSNNSQDLSISSDFEEKSLIENNNNNNKKPNKGKSNQSDHFEEDTDEFNSNNSYQDESLNSKQIDDSKLIENSNSADNSKLIENSKPTDNSKQNDNIKRNDGLNSKLIDSSKRNDNLKQNDNSKQSLKIKRNDSSKQNLRLKQNLPSKQTENEKIELNIIDKDDQDNISEANKCLQEIEKLKEEQIALNQEIQNLQHQIQENQDLEKKQKDLIQKQKNQREKFRVKKRKNFEKYQLQQINDKYQQLKSYEQEVNLLKNEKQELKTKIQNLNFQLHQTQMDQEKELIQESKELNKRISKLDSKRINTAKQTYKLMQIQRSDILSSESHDFIENYNYRKSLIKVSYENLLAQTQLILFRSAFSTASEISDINNDNQHIIDNLNSNNQLNTQNNNQINSQNNNQINSQNNNQNNSQNSNKNNSQKSLNKNSRKSSSNLFANQENSQNDVRERCNEEEEEFRKINEDINRILEQINEDQYRIAKLHFHQVTSSIVVKEKDFHLSSSQNLRIDVLQKIKNLREQTLKHINELKEKEEGEGFSISKINQLIRAENLKEIQEEYNLLTNELHELSKRNVKLQAWILQMHDEALQIRSDIDSKKITRALIYDPRNEITSAEIVEQGLQEEIKTIVKNADLFDSIINDVKIKVQEIDKKSEKGKQSHLESLLRTISQKGIF